MALKDWKKTVSYDGTVIIFLKRKTYAVRVQKINNKWYYSAEMVNPRVVLFEKKYLTKTQALARAKAYMRTH